MEQIIVTRADNSTYSLFTKSGVSTVLSAVQKKTLKGEDVINMSVESSTPIQFKLRDSITIFGCKYTLNGLPLHKKLGTRKHTYELTWESKLYDLLRAMYFDEGVDGVSISPDFSLTGKLSDFLNVLINNLDREFGSGVWGYACDDSDYKTLSYSNQNCLAVLQDLCSEKNFDQEFEIIENQNGTFTINVADTIGQPHSHIYEYGKGGGLFSFERKTISTKNLINRLYVFGSTKNIPSNYRGYSQRLKIPDVTKSFIEDATSIELYGKIEGVKIFEEIFPHREGRVNALGSSTNEFSDSLLDFDVNNYLTDATAKIHFNTGKLAGYEFDILSYNHTTKKFIIKSFQDERLQWFPDPLNAAFQIALQDKYVIVGINMPSEYIENAELDLRTAGIEYLGQNSQPRVQYSLVTDEFFLKKLYTGAIVNVYGLGDSLHIRDTDIGVDKSIRIKSFTRDLFQVYKYDVDISDTLEPTLVQRLTADNVETRKIIEINKLNDISRARRNWRDNVEVMNSIFDQEGYFDPAKIKPASIETLALTVGSRASNMLLTSVVNVNYNRDKSQVLISSGQLVHFQIDTVTRTWTMDQATVTGLVDASVYYVYAKCAKSGTWPRAGIFVVTIDKIMVDSDANYYHFLVGILNSVSDGWRDAQITCGVSTLVGRLLSVGTITGNNLTINLDSGVITGKVAITSGSTGYENMTDKPDLSKYDGKKRVFVAQPTTPYEIGDLWTTGNNLYKCRVERLSGAYNSADWDLATNYDKTETIIDGGLVTTGRIEVGNKAGANAGINGAVSGDPDNDIRFWAGASYANRGDANYLVKNNGASIMKGVIEFGTLAAEIGSILQSIAMRGSDIWENSYDNNNSAIWINRIGYNGGDIYYRNMVISDGKGHKTFHINGKSPYSEVIFGHSSLPVNIKAYGFSIDLGGAHAIATGTDDIYCSATEDDMSSMSITLTPKGNKMFVMFSAPFYVSAANQTLHLFINIAGSNVRHTKNYIIGGFQVISFQHIESVTPGSAITVKIRWYGASAIVQRGSSDAERVLTVIDLM